MAKNKNFSASPAKGSVLLYGRHPVFAAIANPSRQILKICAAAENAPELKKHLTANQKDNVPLQIVDRKDIDKMLPREAVHQGYAAQCKELENSFFDLQMENLQLKKELETYKRSAE